MPPNNVVEQAKLFATAAHAGQFRRDGRTPYVSHLQAVVERVTQRQVSETSEAVAWLHDVIEDTKYGPTDLFKQNFSVEVVEAVMTLTRRKDIGESYSEFLGRVIQNPIAREVKIADLLSNLADSPSAEQITHYAKALLFLNYL